MKNTKDNIMLFENLTVASGIFFLAVALLLVINYIHISQTKPLETDAMTALVQQFQSDPESATLKTDIRNLDLLARKAYFTSRWQIKTGTILLLLGGLAFALFLRISHTLKARIHEPLIDRSDSGVIRILSQRWILIIGGLCLGSALAASFLTTDYLKIYETAQNTETGDGRPETGDRSFVIPAKAGTSSPTNKSDVAGTPSLTTNADQQETTVIAVDTSSVIPAQAGTVIPTKVGTPSLTTKSDIAGTSSPTTGFRDNHPSFRGPWGQGISYQKDIPVSWDGATGKNVKWKVALAKKGYNSPVIWDDRLFIAGAENGSEVVYCFNRLDGKLLWEQSAKGIPGSPAVPPKVTGDTGLSAPSVTTDGKHVYAIFATGDLIALDVEGKQIWAKNLGIPDNHYGHSSSLICWKEKVIIQFDTNKGGRLLALNTLTGAIIWDTPRTSKISWSSPIMAEINGKFQVITTSSPTVAGYDFDSGAQLWAIDCLSGEVGPSAAYYDGLVYAANEYATLAAIKPGPSPTIVWQADEYLPECSSPAVSDGLLFIATSYGMFVCYDAKTGEKLWEKEYGQGFYGSPMIADSKVYVMDRGGTMHIFRLSRTMTHLGDPVLGEKSVVTPAFAPGAIYLKGDKSLYCIAE